MQWPGCIKQIMGRPGLSSTDNANPHNEIMLILIPFAIYISLCLSLLDCTYSQRVSI